MTFMNTRAYSKTHHVFRMLNLNQKTARNLKKCVFFGIQTNGRMAILGQLEFKNLKTIGPRFDIRLKRY